MAFGINKRIKKLLFFSNISNISAFVKKKKLQKKYCDNNVKIGLFSSVKNSVLKRNSYIGTGVKIYDSELGEYSYVNSDTFIRKTTIGKFCSIGSKVIFGLGKHPVDLVSSHPTFYSNNKGFETFSDKTYFEEYFPIKVGNDVWIGYGSIIMGGVEIGDGAIIAAGAIVTKNVEPYSIVGGVPAKHIKYRFDKETIDKLLKIKWWDFDEEWLRMNYKLFHNPDTFIKILNNKKNE